MDLETELAEWEGLVGQTLIEALKAGTARVEAGDPYALAEMIEQQRITIIKLRDAFDQVARSRNEWRDRAKRAQAQLIDVKSR
jgi:hypothetical protein